MLLTGPKPLHNDWGSVFPPLPSLPASFLTVWFLDWDVKNAWDWIYGAHMGILKYGPPKSLPPPLLVLHQLKQL